MMSLVSRPHMQIILFVQNMNSEVRFYRDVLGLPLRYPQGLDDFASEMWVEFEMGDTLLALHGGAEEKPDDLHQIVFTVDNVAQSREMIINAGIEMGSMRTLEDDSLSASGFTPNGHRFSIRSRV